jgi:hypothetical protein
MTEQEIKAAIEATPKGANIMVEWERPVKVRAAYKGLPLTKRTKMLCRIGVAYDNKASVIEGRDNGDLPAENAGLKGFEWEQYPTLLRAEKTGLLYIRLEAGTFKNVQTIVQYFLDGQEVKKADYEHTMLSNETQTREDFAGTFNCKVETIRYIQDFKAEAVEEAEAEAV